MVCLYVSTSRGHTGGFALKLLFFFFVLSHKLKLAVKLKADYSPVLHMPVLKEGKDRMSQYPDGLHDNEAYMQPGEWEASPFSVFGFKL